MSTGLPDPAGLTTREEFAKGLTRLREQAGLTVRQVTGKAGVPVATVGGWMSGRNLPQPSQVEILFKVLTACGVTDPDTLDEWRQALLRVRRVPGPRPAGAPVPYRGLASFQPEDADWFFGREALTHRVVERLGELRAAGGGLLAVVGASGAGKSSLLRAGVIPALRCGAIPGVQSWPVLLFTPGTDPRSELRRRLESRNGGVVVVVDQLEELFAPGISLDEQRRFVAELESVATGGLVLVGLRADFYGPALGHPPLARSLQQAQVVVPPMTGPELRRAITEPAKRAHVDVDDGLVELLLSEVAPPVADPSNGAHESGTLPLLSHALLATCEQGQYRRLTVAGYRATGGLREAVANSAEAVYNALSGSERGLARQLFLRLVHVAADGPDTRRRAARDDLVHGRDDAESAALAAVLERFTERRLVTVDTEAVQISHEVLLAAWPRLRDWVEADRAGLLTGQRLLEAAQGWDRESRDPAGLYQGSRLVAARDWAADHRGGLPPVVHEFLAASTGRERRTVRRLHRTVAALVALLLLAVAGGVVAAQQRARALAEQAAATAERNRAISRLVAGRADRVRDEDVSVAAQLGLVAYEIWPTPEARAALLDTSAAHTATRMLGSVGVMQSVALSPDRRLLAAGTADRTVLLWDMSDPGQPSPLGEPLTGPEGIVFSVAFSPDGRTLAAGDGEGRVYRWDMSDPGQPSPLGEPLTGPEGIVFSVAFSPDGRTLAAGSGDHLVHRWDMSDPRRPGELSPLTGAGGFVQSVAFSPDGNVLAAGSDDATVRLWDVRDPARPAPLGEPLTGPAGTVFSVAFSPDGATLAAGSRDGNVYLWNVTDPGRSEPFEDPLAGASGWVQATAFSPDGETLAAASSGQVWLWQRSRPATDGAPDWRTARVTAKLPHSGPVTSLVYGADADTLITGAADGTARLWRLPGPMLPGDDVTINNVRFSPDGAMLAVASGETRLWSVAERAPVGPPITNSTGFSGAVAFTPDAGALFVSDRDGRLHTWDITDPERLTRLGEPVDAHQLLIEQMALSPDGTTLATGGDDNLVRLWDVTDTAEPALVAELVGFDAYVYSVVFSPDGELLAAASVDNTVRMWNVADPSRPAELAGPMTSSDHYALSVAFSLDGAVVAVGSADKNIYLWDVTDPGSPARLGPPMVGAGNYVYALAHSPDGHTLAAANTDETVWLWDVTDHGRPSAAATLAAGSGALYTTVFSPDGGMLAAGGAGNTVWLWNTDPEQVAADICRTAGDPLTTDEWKKYVPDLAYRRPC